MHDAQLRPAVKRRHAVRAAAQRDPRAEAEFLRGLALGKDNHWAEAARAFGRAAAHNPQDAVFWLNLANAHVQLGELDRAADAARRAMSVDPQSELALAIATQCLAAANHHEETIAVLQRLDLDQVKDPSVHFSLGGSLVALNRQQEAVGAFLAALQRKPDFMPAHVQLGNVFERLKMHEEARECFQTALALGGNRAELLSAMAHQAQNACRWDLFDKDYAELQRALADGLTQAAPFQLLTMPSTRAQQLAAARTHWLDRCGTIEPLPRAATRGARERIHVGYVTNDLCRHATAYLIAEVLERHDRSRFEVFVYSYGQDDASEIRKRIAAACGEQFVDACQMSDRALAERIRRDDIDILVDLKGYTLGSRIRVFAFRPARVQVNYLGYPGTLGAPCYDYIIGDPIVTPLDHAAEYSEKIAQMPRCYQPNDRLRIIGARPTRAACGLPEKGFVFCSFNGCYKITAEVFERWCRLLRGLEGSVLWLYEANPQARRNVLEHAQRRGVAPERLVWAPHVALDEHLGRLQLADLALDTLPVNSHTTASDALWAGVPLVTATGESFVSRVAGSVLHACDLPELVAADADAYERLARELAHDPARLGDIRSRLAEHRKRCSLFDSQTYTRDLEALFARMLALWQRGAAPEHLRAG